MNTPNKSIYNLQQLSQKKTKEDVICPECGATFPESYRKQRCSECGHPLVILEQRDPITAAKAEADLKREMGE